MLRSTIWQQLMSPDSTTMNRPAFAVAGVRDLQVHVESDSAPVRPAARPARSFLGIVEDMFVADLGQEQSA
jgi:hypothetical protein